VIFEVYVSGSVSSVNIRATYASTGSVAAVINMSYSGSGESGGMWTATEKLYSGRYNIYVVALGADGVESSQSLGLLDVYPYRNPTSTGPARGT
jgi:hypothetical protein